MTGTEEASPDREATQEECAIETINAIFLGADPTDEATKLSNGFTDRQVSRLTAWFRRP